MAHVCLFSPKVERGCGSDYAFKNISYICTTVCKCREGVGRSGGMEKKPVRAGDLQLYRETWHLHI